MQYTLEEAIDRIEDLKNAISDFTIDASRMGRWNEHTGETTLSEDEMNTIIGCFDELRRALENETSLDNKASPQPV